ncbi:putative membrane lipoprotein [Perilla frutescens var. hirtella]|uniref:Epidermal patterning factor-like protein n=1 Tax=Perilla frutescens var. hirtella TaxID=608512 RepID=A0AAD4PBZ2_PERFH|nr:putative membrane lipoprotein [Perilla frutescens var. frutescens]KAH6786704.1 putative membrane lipoprotein [Perilla frutescens var. hirtella]KAH6834729.1 putative membrane lipoprotein [Perilla frutescens var. hirtella]
MEMSTTYNTLSIVSIIFLLLSGVTYHSKGINYKGEEKHIHVKEGELGMELYPTGSSLPDCSHACGPCSPCRRVIVSFNKCAVESCPIVYRCMCKGKYYHVPSN